MNYTKLYNQYLDEAKSRGYFKSRMLGRKAFNAKLESDVRYGKTPEESIETMVDTRGRQIDAWQRLYDWAMEHGAKEKVGKIGKIEERNLVYGSYDAIMDRFGDYVNAYYDKLMAEPGMTSTDAEAKISSDIFGSK